jgi:hypothetical protein
MSPKRQRSQETSRLLFRPTAQRVLRRASCIATVFFPEAGGPVKMNTFFKVSPFVRFIEDFMCLFSKKSREKVFLQIACLLRCS